MNIKKILLILFVISTLKMLKTNSPIFLQNMKMIGRQLFLLFKKSTTFWDNPRTAIMKISVNFFTFFRAYVNCSGPGFALHSDIVMPYISHFGTPEQIEKYIPNMTAGKCIGAIAMTEPGAGRYLSRSARKPVFGVSSQVRHNPDCTTTEDV